MNNAFMEVVRFTQGLTKEDVLMKDLRMMNRNNINLARWVISVALEK